MSLPSTLELLAAWWAADQGCWTIWFEAGYAGETFCCSEVRVSAAAAEAAAAGPVAAGARWAGTRWRSEDRRAIEDAVVAVARDCVLEVLAEERRPVSVVIGLEVESGGLIRTVLERGYPT